MLTGEICNVINKSMLMHTGDRVLVAVSGGPDSIALLHVLHMLKDELNIKLYVAHFNHGFRGKESDEDANFVEQQCKELSVSCTVKYVNVPEILKKQKSESTQAVSRELRYEFLVETARKNNCNVIAVAHILEDQTETFFLRLLRGSGVKGLVGMQLKIEITKGIFVVRPFLFTSREKINKFLEKNKLSSRLDSSNLHDHYLRNHIRHHFIPQIKKDYNPRIDESIKNLSSIIAEEDDFINMVIQEIFIKIIKFENDKIKIKIEEYKKLHPAIKKRIIRKILETLKGDLKKITFKHIEAIDNLSTLISGKTIDLPDNIIIKHEFDYIVFEKKKEKFEEFKFTASVPSEINMPQFGVKISISIKKNILEENTATKEKALFSFPIMPKQLIIRNRREGDSFVPSGMQGSKKIKKIFIEQKISISERDKIPLIVYENEIIWIAGVRQSEHYKAKESEVNIVEIKIEKINL